ncbi:hypothetical protein [Pseudoduganella flava]|uniref:Uncharacterized protein n=1 Tax=Pseudoduganella flava TaxID=871742 RepID=A0ABX6FLU4_9BURK|nr:hypothetical protein [Pseudoduganella flava]QGZ38121.1 hypothetical protein GO485_03025 [Pseudoduganella flava]
MPLQQASLAESGQRHVPTARRAAPHGFGRFDAVDSCGTPAVTDPLVERIPLAGSA